MIQKKSGQSLRLASGESRSRLSLRSLADCIQLPRAVTVLSQISWALPVVHMLPSDHFTRRGMELTTKWVGERVKRGSSIKDLFYFLVSGMFRAADFDFLAHGISQLDEEAPESERPALEAVASEGILAVIAGSDTTSTTLTIVLYYLLRHPDKLKKLSAEIDFNFIRDEDAIDFTRLVEMQYLNACMCVLPYLPSDQTTVILISGA